jgi:hypothetical protein
MKTVWVGDRFVQVLSQSGSGGMNRRSAVALVKRCVLRNSVMIVILAGLCAAVCLGGDAVAGTRFGISGVAGGGVFVAADKDYYHDISADIYPEIGIMMDLSVVRAGVKVGWIYRKVEWWFYPYHGSYTLSFLPVQLDLLVAPLSGHMITPYVGISPGVFIPVGDNEDVLPAISLKLGMELVGGPFLLYGDLRYTYAKEDNYRESINAGGVMLVIGGGIRVGSE